jgi:polyisoprenyl-phosphate glycosyltransferase
MISVVIPLLNEEQLVVRLLEKLWKALKKTGENFEVVCVDDGSKDTTLQKLLRYRQEHHELKVLALSRNFGLQAALTAGIDYAKGEHVVIMDGDFQDPPELIPVLFEKMKATDADIVSAVREGRNEKCTKKIYINIFHRIFDRLTGVEQVAQTGNFCLINRKAHQAMLRFSERNRYLPGIRNFIGFKHEFILYERPERLEGKAKMKLGKLFSLAADAIYSFSKWPIKFCLYLGLLGIIIFFLAIVYTFISKISNLAPIGWSSMFLAISFFGSVQLTFLGLIGEYIYRIFKEVQNRPLYFIDHIYD